MKFSVTLIGGQFDGAIVNPAHCRNDSLIVGVRHNKGGGYSFYVLESTEGDRRRANYIGTEIDHDDFTRCRYIRSGFDDRRLEAAEYTYMLWAEEVDAAKSRRSA